LSLRFRLQAYLLAQRKGVALDYGKHLALAILERRAGVAQLFNHLNLEPSAPRVSDAACCCLYGWQLTIGLPAGEPLY
jgi:hypothetical protein